MADLEKDPATTTLSIVVGRCAAAMRGGLGLVASAAGLLGVGAPASVPLTTAAVALNTVWVAVFVPVVLARGFRPWLMAGEVALTCALSLGQGGLVAAGMVSGGTSWVAGLVTMTFVVTGLAWRARLSVPCGLLVAGCHLTGSRLAGAEDGGVITAGIHVVQILAVAGLTRLLRDGARLADRMVAAESAERTAENVRLSRRRNQRAQNRILHDSSLNVLTAVAQGGVRTSDLRLRNQALHALAELALTRDPGTDPPPVELSARLRTVIDHADVPVKARLTAREVPWAVAEAFAGAVAEALTNVARHSGAGRAAVEMTVDPGITVEVTDEGRGFDVTALPAHRFGVRESIEGRMAAVDGSAEVTSEPGRTRVLLRWGP